MDWSIDGSIDVTVREAGIEVAKQAEANYPESLRKIFVINGN